MSWQNIKAMVEKRPEVYCKPMQVWWAYYGENIGKEQNGKGDRFLRPVLVVRSFSKSLCFVVPLTTNHAIKEGCISFEWRKLNGEASYSTAALFQANTISSKRLVKKMGILKKIVFKPISKTLFRLLKEET